MGYRMKHVCYVYKTFVSLPPIGIDYEISTELTFNFPFSSDLGIIEKESSSDEQETTNKSGGKGN